MEACYGCGIRTEGQHPVVAVMANNDNEPTKIGEDPAKKWMAVAVCNPCHQKPEHRTVNIKGAFFMRQDMVVALRLADMQNVRLPGK